MSFLLSILIRIKWANIRILLFVSFHFLILKYDFLKRGLQIAAYLLSLRHWMLAWERRKDSLDFPGTIWVDDESFAELKLLIWLAYKSVLSWVFILPSSFYLHKEIIHLEQYAPDSKSSFCLLFKVDLISLSFRCSIWTT